MQKALIMKKLSILALAATALLISGANGIAANGTNIAVCYGNNSTAQKFKFEKYEEQ